MSAFLSSTAAIISFLYFISVKIFIILCFKNSKTSASTLVLSVFKTPSSSKASKDTFTNSFNEISSPEFTIILTIPNAALLNAKGSFEPVGINPTPKQPTKVSNLSEIPAIIPSIPVGNKSPWNLG